MATEIPARSLELYDKLIASVPDIERKGKTSPYTSHNGHMFSYLSKTGSMGLRLGESDRTAFLEQFNTTLFEQYGSVMKEFVTVPEDLLENTTELRKHLIRSFEYVGTLKKKPGKKT